MLPRIVWRPRALAWSVLPAGSALLLAAACGAAPLPLSVHPVMPATAHAAMAMPAHAAMQVPNTADAPALVAAPATNSVAALADGPLVDIQAFQYSMPTLTVPVGTTVTWTNHDVEPHTVTANDRAFASSGLETNDTFAFRFDRPGTYAYHCALHPFMTGQIVVQ